MQVKTKKFVYLIDTLSLYDKIFKDFCPKILENQNIVKVVIGCKNDVAYLQHNFSTFLTAAIHVQLLYQEFKRVSPDWCEAKMIDVFEKHLVEMADMKAKYGYPKVEITPEDIYKNWLDTNEIGYQKLVPKSNLSSLM